MNQAVKAIALDLQFVLNLAQEFNVYGPYVPIFQNLFNQAVHPGNDGSVEFFIHKDINGTSTGFIAVQWSAGLGDVHGVVVDQVYRGKGYAKELLDHVLGLARQRGVQTLKAITAALNAAALRSFQRAGYNVGNGVAGLYPNGQQAVNLWRQV